MKVIFAKDSSIHSKLIRLFTWSKWHHCGIINGDTVIEARANGGVIKTPLQEFIDRYEETEIGEITGDITKAFPELGKPYDWGAIFGIVFRRSSWQKKDKWFCSELIAYCSSVFRNTKTSRITPEHLYMVTKKIKEEGG